MNWNALLQWSIAQKDGFDKDTKMMDEDTRKWLEEALENQTFDENKRMIEILGELQELPEDEVDKIISLYEDLSDILDALDRSNKFCQIQGLQLMQKHSLSSKNSKIQIEALKIIQSCNQNNSFVQNWSFDNNTEDIKLKEQLFSTLSSMIRGECLKIKRQFIDRNGIQIILENLSTQKCREKAINIIRDLLLYDDNLHQTYNDLSKFQNTSGVKLKTQSLSQDGNEILAKENLLPENQKYRGIVKKILNEINFPKYSETYLSDNAYRNSDTRIAFIQCLKQFNFDASILQKHKENLSHAEEIDQTEIELC
ncbi:hypothetical protein pb186bvf_010706 [Paramecium bursaria]